jgi:glucose-6-phosphate 1-dehydrogenase
VSDSRGNDATFRADALVFFGATGDLAYKQIFPALQEMVRNDELKVPVIGVALAGWDLEQLKERARDSLAHSDRGIDPEAFAKLMSLLRYVDGDYAKASTFAQLRAELGSAEHPVHYLAIPPVMFTTVIEQLQASGCADGGRVVIEKPFGHDLASARELNAAVRKVFPEDAIFRIDHFLGKEPVENLFYFRFANSFTEPFWNRDNVEAIQITMAETFGVADRGAFYDATGAIRDVIQNHLLQIVSLLTLDAPSHYSPEAVHREQLRIFESLRPLRPDDVVRGQFRGYQDAKGVKRGSTVETYAAVRLHLDSWRWSGVPIVIRAGKRLPVTATEVIVDLKTPPQDLFGEIRRSHSNFVRFHIGEEMAISIGAKVFDPGQRLGEDVELYAQRQKTEMIPPYERLLTDAMHGHQMLFSSQEMVEAMWRVVEPILGDVTPVHRYEPGTWGPEEAEHLLAHYGGWRAPVPPGETS